MREVAYDWLEPVAHLSLCYILILFFFLVLFWGSFKFSSLCIKHQFAGFCLQQWQKGSVYKPFVCFFLLHLSYWYVVFVCKLGRCKLFASSLLRHESSKDLFRNLSYIAAVALQCASLSLLQMSSTQRIYSICIEGGKRVLPRIVNVVPRVKWLEVLVCPWKRHMNLDVAISFASTSFALFCWDRNPSRSDSDTQKKMLLCMIRIQSSSRTDSAALPSETPLPTIHITTQFSISLLIVSNRV